MASKIKEALKENLQDLVSAGIKTTFTKKRLNEIGVIIPTVEINSSRIKKIRKNLKLSQAVFAKLLNVSLSSIRHWEQGIREPTGSTMILLELLSKQPGILNYRLGKFYKKAA